jgi:hypothetical protein
MTENADFDNNRILALTNLGNMLSNISEEEQANINNDLPLLLLVIGVLTNDLNRINYVKERWGEERFILLVNTSIPSSSFTLGTLISMGYSVNDFINNNNSLRSSSPTSISEPIN